jgi:hypothetical protein
MGGIINFFRSIKEFFENIAQLGKAIGKWFIEFVTNPFGVIMKIFIAILGFWTGIILMILWVMFKPMTYVLFALNSFCVSGIISICVTIAASSLWILYSAITLLIYTIDFFTGGYAFQLFLCEEEIDEWVFRGNYASGNRCERSFVCKRPCSERYSPALGGTMCVRNPDHQPMLCPQQYIYRTHVLNTDKDYSDYLGNLPSGKIIFDKVDATPIFKLRSKYGKVSHLQTVYKQKQKFLTQCYEAMSPYDNLTKNLCTNVNLLYPNDKNRENIKQLCSQIYCDYKYVPASEKPSTCVRRPIHEAEGLCQKYKTDIDTSEQLEDINALIQRIFFGLLAVIAFYIIILSVQRLYDDIEV